MVHSRMGRSCGAVTGIGSVQSSRICIYAEEQEVPFKQRTRTSGPLDLWLSVINAWHFEEHDLVRAESLQWILVEGKRLISTTGQIIEAWNAKYGLQRVLIASTVWTYVHLLCKRKKWERGEGQCLWPSTGSWKCWQILIAARVWRTIWCTTEYLLYPSLFF